jgi:CubicO group peptidase (beta-lactamase class C family)
VAKIVHDRAATWDSRIADIDPTFQLFEPYPTEHVTIRDLFSHRSGLPGNAGNELEEIGYDRDEILYRLRYVPPASSFGTGYSYSNFGLTEGAVAAAKAAGMTWEDAAEEKLYKPLGMVSTSSRHADFLSRTNRAVLHVRFDGKWQALSKRQPDAQSPAGGVSSSARDLAQWMRLELGNGRYDGEQMITKDVIEQSHWPVVALGNNPITGAPSFYGLGWNIEHRRYGVVWGHPGAFSDGARTIVSIVPSEQLGLVVLTNAFPTGVPEAVADTFFNLVSDSEASVDWLTESNRGYAMVFGAAREQAKAQYGSPPASPSPALSAAAYVGTYTNDYVGHAIVEEADGGLTLRLGPRGEKSFPLTHFDRDLFIYYPYDETPDFPFAVTFQIGPGQTATDIVIDHLNELRLGNLRRKAA